jgi:hypothetical protein
MTMFDVKRGFLNGLLFAADAIGGGMTNPGEAVGGLIPKAATPEATAPVVAAPITPASVAADATTAGQSVDKSIDGLPEELQVYIRGLRKEAETNREAAKAAADSASAAETARLVEQGKYKELYEKTAAEMAAAKSGEDRVKELETAFNTTLEARIAAVPKELQGLIPRALPPVALSAWLDANAAVLTTRMAPKLDAGASSVSGQPYAGSQDHMKKVAQRYNIAIKGVNG